MEREALLDLARRWQIKLKKRYQNPDQLLEVLEAAWLKNDVISTAALFLIASRSKGINIKPHAKLRDDEGLKDGHISAPRSSRRRGGGGKSNRKPFDRVR